MSDAAPASSIKNRLSAWLKTFLGTLAGLLSGAAMMYLSPLLDRVVKPAKPIANFAVDHEGRTAAFTNRSSGGSEGWWDFGDGSPLEPLSKQETVTHTYSNPGTYAAKLSVRNLIGEESERTVTVQLDVGRAEPPAIVALDAVSVSPGAFAPATFRVVSQAKNAKLCVWDYGDDRNLEISTQSPNAQDRFVVFNKSGGYVVKLAAVNGEQAVEKSTVVYVDDAPPGAIVAILRVADHGTRIEKDESAVPVTAAWPPDCKDDVFRFDRPVPARGGFTITAARLEAMGDRGVRNLAIKVASDGLGAHVTGELVRQGSRFMRSSPPPGLVVRVLLSQERRLADRRPAIPVTGTLNVPGSLLLPMPPLPSDWSDVQRQLRLELREGDRVVWPEAGLPRASAVTLQNHRWILQATSGGSQVRIQLTEDRPAAQARSGR